MRQPMVRSSILSDLQPFLAERGASAHDRLREVGLPLRCLAEPDYLVRVGKVNRLLELASQRLAMPDFGLQLSRTRRLAKLGVVGALMRDEQTVRDALQRFIANSHLNSSATWLQLREEGDLALLRVFIDADRQPAIRQATEMAVGGLVRILQQLLRPDWRPREVWFCHTPVHTAGLVRQFFGCPVRFGAEWDGFAFDRNDLDQGLPLADAGLARYVQMAATQATPHADSPRVHRVKQRIFALMMDGRCSAGEVAASLGIDRRTLHRHLAAEGTGYQQVHDAIRLEIAQRQLRTGTAHLSQLAQAVGCGSLSSFSRWFKLQTGLSPTRWVAAGAPHAREPAIGEP